MPVRTSYRDQLPPLSRSPRQTRARKLRVRLRSIEKMLAHGKLEAATLAVQALVQRTPYDVRALSLAARCLVEGHNHSAALELYDRILLQEDSDVVWLAKARCLLALGRYRRASISFARATALAGNSRFIPDQAECLLVAGKLTVALTLLEANPPAQRDPRYDLVHAKTLAQMGRIQDAFTITSAHALHDQSKQAIKLAEQYSPKETAFSELCDHAIQDVTAPAILAVVAKNHPHFISPEHEEQLNQITQSLACNDPRAAQAHLALFRLYDHRKDSFAALAHLRHFHACAHKTDTRRSYESALFTKLMQLNFTPLQSTKTSVLPIFVTGLPGSGLQTASKVLTQAAGCVSAQPLSIVPAVMTRFIRSLRERNDNDVTREDLLNLQAELRKGLQQSANGRDIVVDTTLANFKWSGLLAAALPEARIIHMKRDTMSTGWAMHSMRRDMPDFSGQHSLEKINAYQYRSANLMTYWETDMTSKIMSVSGDALMRPSGATARAIVEACQLKWSGNCELTHAQPDRDWHRYAAYLNPLRQDTTTVTIP